MDLIAVVTGASRGAGKGIAIALGEAGATVYVTGRSVADSDSLYGGTVSETADLVTQAGGNGVAIALDHTDDKAVAALFERVKAEHGRLDILGKQRRKVGRRSFARRFLGETAGSRRPDYCRSAFAFRGGLLCRSALDRKRSWSDR